MQLFKTKHKKGIISTEVTLPKAQSLLKISSNNLLPLFVLGSLGLQGLLFLQTTFNTIWIAKLANRPAPTLVELEDGRSIQVGATDSQERTPRAIKNFATQILTMLFSTTGRLNSDFNNAKNNSQPKQDLGIVLQGGKGFRSNSKITTAAWLASFALSEEFRSSFLSELADITPPGVFAGLTQTVLSINYLSEPEQISQGKWKLNMVANLYIFAEGDRVGQVIPVNKTIYVKAVYVVPQPLVDNATGIQRVIYQAREAGLEIYRFGDLTSSESSTQPSPAPSPSPTPSTSSSSTSTSKSN